MGDEHKVLSHSMTDCDLPAFLYRMIRVWVCHGEGVEEHCYGVFERDTVLFQIGHSFAGVPFKDHAALV